MSTRQADKILPGRLNPRDINRVWVSRCPVSKGNRVGQGRALQK